MAAVLCRGLGQICSSLGDVVCIPCKLCGMSMDVICDVMSSPFCPYISVTYLLMIPVVLVFGLQGLLTLIGGDGGDCGSTGGRWLTINMFLSLVHMIASVYIVFMICKKEDHERDGVSGDGPAVAVVTGVDNSKVEEGKYYAAGTSGGASSTIVQTLSGSGAGDDENTDRYSMSRVRHILCEDLWIALYIIFAIVWIIYQTIGAKHIFSLDGSESDVCGNIKKWMSISIVLDWLYIWLAIFSFLITLCCMGCRK